VEFDNSPFLMRKMHLWTGRVNRWSRNLLWNTSNSRGKIWMVQNIPLLHCESSL